MKTYRITDSFRITPNEKTVMFELGELTVDYLDDEFVSKLLNILIGLVYSPKETFVQESVQFKSIIHNQGLEVIFRHEDEKEYIVDFAVFEGEEIKQVLTIDSRWMIIKMTEILTFILPQICEEGC